VFENVPLYNFFVYDKIAGSLYFQHKINSGNYFCTESNKLPKTKNPNDISIEFLYRSVCSDSLLEDCKMMKIRQILRTIIFFTVIFLITKFPSSAEDHTDTLILSGFDKGPTALEFEYFPSRLHTFIWRNWSVVPVQRLSEVLETSIENVNRIAVTIGLPPQQNILPIWESSQGYITVLRRNRHLLPFSQILVLLNQTPEQLAESLQEDDFLFIKLGSIKPQCESLRFAEPTAEQIISIKYFLEHFKK
jgi:hypothetical protein